MLESSLWARLCIKQSKIIHPGGAEWGVIWFLYKLFVMFVNLGLMFTYFGE